VSSLTVQVVVPIAVALINAAALVIAAWLQTRPRPAGKSALSRRRRRRGRRQSRDSTNAVRQARSPPATTVSSRVSGDDVAAVTA